MTKPCREDEGYAHPEDRVDRLGRVFATLRLHERTGLTFEKYVQLVEDGVWRGSKGQMLMWS